MIHGLSERVWVFGESISVIDPATDQIHNVKRHRRIGNYDHWSHPSRGITGSSFVMPNGNGIIVFDPDQLWEATSAYGLCFN